MLEISLKVLAAIFIIGRIIYWIVTEKQADKEKPKLKVALKVKMQDLLVYLIWILLCIQLTGVEILPFQNNNIQLVGFCIFLLGIIISILGRHHLGNNWTHAGEHQIKKQQELVTCGIYKYIRHPIYLGVFFAIVGGELVAESYLTIFFFVFLLYGSYTQAKKEESLLLRHFGKKYELYVHSTKMFIPYIL